MEGFNQNNGKCANRRLSQPRGSPQATVAELWLTRFENTRQNYTRQTGC
jgi:hypothetical protein